VVRNYSYVVRNYQSSILPLKAAVFWDFPQKPSAGIHIPKEY